MNNHKWIYLIQSALHGLTVDDQFTALPPCMAPGAEDVIYVYLDYTRDGPPFSTCPAICRITEMQGMGRREVIQYIEKKLRKAEQELREFVSKSEDDSDDGSGREVDQA